MAPIPKTEGRRDRFVEYQSETISRPRRIVLPIAPELHPLEESSCVPSVERLDRDRLRHAMVPALPPYLFFKELLDCAAPFTPMPHGNKRRPAAHNPCLRFHRALPSYDAPDRIIGAAMIHRP